MCLKNYLSIRGECATAKIYLDELQGINIINLADITSGTLPRPIDVVNNAFELAQKEVVSDMFALIDLNYNAIVDDHSYTKMGNHKFYGEVVEDVIIKVIQLQSDKFIKLHVFGFQILSDRDITKDFVITDGYDNVEIVTVDLVKGLNDIPLDKFTNSEYIKITFDVSDFKIGIKQTSYCEEVEYFGSCEPCQRHGCGCECAYVRLSTNQAGFNLCVRCEADECQLLKYFVNEVHLPLLFKTGINVLLQSKLSDRWNSFVGNKKDDIEEMLTLWMGGYNNATQTGVSSMYKHHLKNSGTKVKYLLGKINSQIFTHSGTTICNVLP